MDDGLLPSKAAAALRVYEGRLHRARHENDVAAKALSEARVALDAADLAHEAAKHVFHASEADRARELGFDKVAPSTRAWLRALAEYDVFGIAEARDAATTVGLTLSDDAIRQHMSRHSRNGVFIQPKRGLYQVSDRAHSELAALHTPSEMHVATDDGDISSSAVDDDQLDDRDAAERGCEDHRTDEGARSDAQPPASAGGPVGHEGDLDYLDDDTPF